MYNLILQSPYFYLAALFLCFILFKTSVSVVHLNPLKMPVIETQYGHPYFFINDVG